MNSQRFLVALLALSPAMVFSQEEPDLVGAFIFGSRELDCPTYNEPAVRYTVVHQGSATDLEYRPARGWGYEVVDPGASGYARFGPFDDSPNNRDRFRDSCPSEIYDSFIGAKNFRTSCTGQTSSDSSLCEPPEGILFRVDVPNGVYRFVAAVGSADNPHTHRVVVEDGGAGPPADISSRAAVLVQNFDQAEYGSGVFARVGFDGFIPPPAEVEGFVNLDEDGHITGEEPRSPTLEVTQGYIRLHQLKGVTSGNDGNGGDLVLLELWRVTPSGPDLTPPAVETRVPSTGATVRRLGEVQITFSEDVVGVDAGDLLANGTAARSVTGSGPGPFVFTFDDPPPGVVRLRWAPGHGITDQAEPANAFPGGEWTCRVDPAAAVGDLVINEILAVNNTGIRDEDLETSDWIEIVNQGSEAVDLTGWALTDDPDAGDDDIDPAGLWVFPARSIEPGEHLLVFASGKDRRPTFGELHTNFKLSSTGERVALLNAESPRLVVSEITPRYPRQRADHSYGRDDQGDYTYFRTPTPGARNRSSVSFDGFVLDPRCTPDRGFYTDPFAATLSTGTPGASLRYTLDGSEPSATHGVRYDGPVDIRPEGGRGIVTLRAIAYHDDRLPSDVVTFSFVFPESVLGQPRDPDGFPSDWRGQPADYEMDPDVVDDPGHHDLVRDGLVSIPTLSIVTDVDNLFDASRGIYANPSREGVAWERPVSAELIYPDGRDGFQVNCGLRIQGGSSTSNWKVIKVSMRLLFKGDYGPTKLRFPLFPDSAVDRFDTIILDAHMNQTWQHPSHGQRVRAQYCRDQYVSDLQNGTGGFAPHDIFAHVYLNGLYWGVFDLHERPDASFAAEHFGGDKSDYDALRHSGSQVIDGNASAWNAMMAAARRNLSSLSNYALLGDHLDIPALIDYMIVNIYAGNDDWAHHNWYATRYRAPGAGYLFHSWDAEHVLKSTTINRTNINNANSPTELYSRLRASSEFRLLFGDHVHRHFSEGGILYVDPDQPRWDPAHPERNGPASIWMRRIDELDPAIACEAARWGDTRRPNNPYTRNDEWARELAWLMDQYFPGRSATVLNQLRAAGLYPDVGAPILNHRGGRIEPGFVLTMRQPSGTSGTIYYTLDGTDPRVFGSGAVSGGATRYSQPVVLNDHAFVMARVRSGDEWSALTSATFNFTEPADAVRITELMYHPSEGSEYEFLELLNTADSTVDLSGAFFDRGIDFQFANHQTLAPGAYLVLVSDADAFQSRYPGVPIGGVYDGKLSNGGEEVRLRDAADETIVSVDYDDDGFWPIGPDGFGYSLVPVDEDGDPGVPTSWRPSARVHGSPGEDDPTRSPEGVVINEILAHGVPPLEDAIELFNPTARIVDVGGWFLSDRRNDVTGLKGFRIPDGTVLGPGGFVVFYERDFGPEAGGGVELAPSGGEVYLSAADANGDLTGYIVEAGYQATVPNRSFGRFSTSVGPQFTALEAPSFGVDAPSSVEEFRLGEGELNGPPAVGPVVINEVMYHPEPGHEEFVELYNPTAFALPLFETETGRGWRVDGVQNLDETDRLEFAPGTEIPAGGFLLLVGIDPEVFRDLHAVPGSVPIVGPFGGGLDNSGERLELLRPALVTGALEYVRVDLVRYNDRPPWALPPDGDGPSLERIAAGSYGNEPSNWAASEPDGGTPGLLNSADAPGGNRAPTAVFSAAPLAGEAPLGVVFDGTQSFDLDGQITRYDWDFGDGATAGGQLVSHTFESAGFFRVTLTVQDDDGARGTTSVVVSVTEDLGGAQLRGDGNQDGRVDISDALKLLVLLFDGSASLPCDGDSVNAGGNRTLLDVNGDGGVNVSDAAYLLTYLFAQGPAPDGGMRCIAIPGCADVCEL